MFIVCCFLALSLIRNGACDSQVPRGISISFSVFSLYLLWILSASEMNNYIKNMLKCKSQIINLNYHPNE